MSKLKTTKNQIKSKIEAIKKINDNPKKISDSIYDKYIKDLPSTNDIVGKKLGAFTNNKKKNNNQDIFGELLEIVNQFIDVKKSKDKYDVNKPTDNFRENFNKRRLRAHALSAATKTTSKTRQIVSDNVKKVFFAADGICGSDATLSTDALNLSPKEIDFTNMLTVSPTTSAGKIIYENESKNLGKQKTNRELYKVFSGGVYSYNTNNNKTLFDVSWDSGTQKYQISGLTQGIGNVRVDEFFRDYYSSLDFPDIKDVVKNTMEKLISGDNGQTNEYNVAQNQLDRLVKKLCTICGQSTNRNRLVNQNAVEQFDENDEDLDGYFDFNDVEGIDIDSEDARLRKVLKFSDCNNFEIPINNALMKDFVYVFEKKSIEDSIDSIINRAAAEAHENSSDIPLVNFQLSLVNSFILQLPKTLISTIVSPKIFLPVVIVYKIFQSLVSTVLDIKELFVKIKKLIYFIVKDILWYFIQEFWKLVKRDLLTFLVALVTRIVKNKYKRYLVIITALITLLKKILQNNLTNCADLFSLILNTINGALSSAPPFNIPGILLGFSKQLPGYSQDRAFINISERLEAAGIPTGPINGEDNDMLSLVKSVIDGHTEEMDQNSFVAASNSLVTIPTPAGPIIIPPGIINVSGKMQ